MTAQGQGFEDYLDRHGAALQRYAFVLTGDAADAEDLVQTALTKAYRRWRRIAVMASPHAYVRRILTHCFIDQRRRGPVVYASDSLTDVLDPAADHAGRWADLDAIIRALDELTRQQRAVLVLRYLLDVSDDDIAAELGCSAATVRSHASRGLHRLRSLLCYPDLEIHHE
ncbi:MAG: SigE family RNA polymerase sigma factor [Microlunatus sp.]|nr:SigE family RNA polymerase sigma factor [Microlunatus sp.]